MLGRAAIISLSSAENPPSGPIRTARGGGIAGSAAPRRAATGSATAALLVAEDEEAFGREFRERYGEPDRVGKIGNRQDAALLGRFDGVGAQAIEIDPLALRITGEDRPDGAGSHLHGLLRQIVEPGGLQWREEVMQVGTFGLRAYLLDNDQFCALAPTLSDAGCAIRRRGR